MEGSSNYLSVGALAAAAGSYAYTYNQIQNIQKEITKVSESIGKSNESIKVYDENVNDQLGKMRDWTLACNGSLADLSDRIASIEQFLMTQLGYEYNAPVEEPTVINHGHNRGR